MEELNRREFLWLSTAGLALSGCGKDEGLEQRAQESLANNIKFLVLEGSPYNRGLIHGRTLSKKIREIVNLWKTDLKKNYKIDPDVFITKFLNGTNYLPAIKKYTPDLLEEVKGISEGSGIDFELILAFQLMDEIWLNGEDILGEHCSGIGLNRTNRRPACIAQNMDLESFRNGFQTLFHIKDNNSDLETLVFSCAGLIATNGINSNRVGICVNAMKQLNYSTQGLPVAFVVRGVLEQSSQKDAIKFLHDIKHASPQNYIIGGPEKIYDFECSSNTISQFVSHEESGIVYHTNHPLSNDDYSSKHLDYVKKHDNEQITKDNSHTRFYALEKRLNVPPEEITIDSIKSALSSHDSEKHPVCAPLRDNSPWFTFGSTIMVLSDRPEFHVSFGPPDVMPYKIYKFSE